MQATLPIQTYFNQSAVWSKPQTDEDIIRIRQTAEMIPGGIESLLDVGCGNGIMLNHLADAPNLQIKRLVGVDQSHAALRHVRTDSCLGSITNLPFGDATFDALLCLEVLEHLPHDDFAKALSELARVASQYILVSVPCNENLSASLVTCPLCHCSFCPHQHVRKFTAESLPSLIPGFRLRSLRSCGRRTHYLFHGTVKKIARVLRLMESFPVTAICPQCHYRGESLCGPGRSDTRDRRHPLAFAMNLLPHWTEPRWLLALFSR